MANEVRTDFVIGGEREAQAKIDRYGESFKKLNEDINAVGKNSFADKFSKGFDDLDRRLSRATDGLRKLSQQKLDKNQFDLISQGAIVAERRVQDLSLRLRSLQKDAANPANAQFSKYYVQGIREIESELAQAERRLQSLRRQQRGISSNSLQSPSGLSNAFNNNAYLAGVTGGLIGGGTVAAFNELINLSGVLTGKIYELAAAGTKMGGDFEVTQNSISVFTGSARLANIELAAVDQTARDTAGLRLESAEQGYQRLRGLGFESKRARALIKELGEEKILSGASNEALNRVLFNFTQIASGGQKISQEIRELLTAMPSLRKAFLDAFGTLDPKKIQEQLDNDPNKFFDKLIAAMEKTKAAQGGLNDAQGKFYDQLTRSGREFSKPFLPELTKSYKQLTKDLENNKETFIQWGKNVNNVLTLVNKATDTKLLSIGLKIADITERIALIGVTGGASFGKSSSEIGDYFRRLTDQAGVTKKGKDYFTGKTFEEQTGVGKDFFGSNFQNNLTDEVQKRMRGFFIETEEEKTARLANEANEKQRKLESDQNKRETQLKELFKNSRSSADEIRRELQNLRSGSMFSTALDDETNNDLIEQGEKALSDKVSTRIRLQLQNTKNSLADLRRILAEVRSGGDLLPDAREGFVNQIESQITQSVEAGKNKVKELEKTYLGVLDNLSSRRGPNNPFVAVISEADRAMRELRDNTKGLPADVRASFEQIQQDFNRLKLFETRLENRLGISDLRSDAANFRNPFDGDRVRREEDEFVQRFLRNNPNYLYLQGKSELDEAGRKDILSRGSFDSQQKRLNDRLDEDFRTIYGNGKLTPEQQGIADRQFISRTSGVNPLDLSNSNREQVAMALEREAARRDRFETQSLDYYKQTAEFAKAIAANTARQNKIAEEQGAKGVELIIKNESDSQVAQKQAARPTAADTQKYYNPGLTFGQGGLTNR